MRKSYSVVTLMTLASVGCSRGQGGDFVVRDSAGIRIMEHASIAGAPPLPFDSTPWLQLGGLSDDERLEFDSRNPFISAITLADGRIAVTDYASVKLFDNTGKYLSTFGKSGNGPGEFGQLLLLCPFANDSLLAVNYQDGRLSIWDPAGQFVKAHARIGTVTETSCFPDGSLLVRQLPERDPSFMTRVTAPYGRVRADGTVLNSLGDLPVGGFGPLARNVSVVAADGRIYVGDPATFEVRVQSLDGKVLSILRVLTPIVPVTDALWREAVEGMFPPQPNRGAMIASVMARPRPATVPTYQQVRADPRGRMWIQDYSANNWTVFDSNGAMMGRLELPRSRERWVMLRSLTRDGFVLTRSDSSGAPVLAFHRYRTPR